MGELEKLEQLTVSLTIGIQTDLQKMNRFLSVEDKCIYIGHFAIQRKREESHKR